MFAELLRHQLEVSHDHALAFSLHQRASQWYEEHDLPDDAIFHALQAKDWERSLKLLIPEVDKRMQRGEMRTAIGWLQALPDDVLRSQPRLFSEYCGALVFAGEPEAANSAIAFLEQTAREDTAIQGEIASLRAVMAGRRGDLPTDAEQSQKALALLPQTSYDARSRASTELGNIRYSEGRLEEAIRHYADAYEAAKKTGRLWTAANGLGWAARALWMRGELKRSGEMAEEAVDLAGQSPAAASPL